MCNKRDLTSLLIKQNNGSVLVNQTDLMKLTGLGRTKGKSLVSGLPHVGGKSTYFIEDVAERMLSAGMG